MVEIIQISIVNSPDVDDTSGSVCQIFTTRFSPLDRRTLQMSKQTAGQEVVFMGAARMGYDKFNFHKSGALRILEAVYFTVQ